MARGRRLDDFMGGRGGGGGAGGQCGPEDVERAARLAAEKVVASIAGRLLDELDALRGEVERLRGEVARLRAVVERLEREGRRQAPRRRGRPALSEVLEEEGFILGSEAKAKLGYGPSRLHSEAVEAGAVVLELGGDIAVLHPRAYEEFVAMLAGVDTPDPEEAARRLGRYSRLFNALRRDGRVYYDARLGYWRLL